MKTMLRLKLVLFLMISCVTPSISHSQTKPCFMCISKVQAQEAQECSVRELDYKSELEARSSNDNSGWIWALVGAAVGLSIGSVVR